MEEFWEKLTFKELNQFLTIINKPSVAKDNKEKEKEKSEKKENKK